MKKEDFLKKINEAAKKVERTDKSKIHLSVSKGNAKLHDLQSVSFPAIITCANCPCQDKCYACKGNFTRYSVQFAYAKNLWLYKNNEEQYWREFKAMVFMNRFIRINVSGDIPDLNYLFHLVDVAKENSHCEILCFTKKYRMINLYLEKYKLPKNLHILFSIWRDYECDNPYKLPEAHVIYEDGFTTASPKAKECMGNCQQCAATPGAGCFTLKKGEQVVFNEH